MPWRLARAGNSAVPVAGAAEPNSGSSAAPRTGTRGARRTFSVVEEPPCGQGESGPGQSGGLGEVDAQGLAELVESAGDTAVVQVEQLSGPAEGAGGAPGGPGLH